MADDAMKKKEMDMAKDAAMQKDEMMKKDEMKGDMKDKMGK